MIKAVLLDLDDTLIESNTSEFFPKYLGALGEFAAQLGATDKVVDRIMASYATALHNVDPLETLKEKFLPIMASSSRRSTDEVERIFASFYRDCFGSLKPYIKPKPLTRELLNWLNDYDYQTVVATNPGLPESAIYQRMAWGGIPVHEESFALVTTLETMHFGKPHLEYYEEIMARIASGPGEAIMVGDDWENDIAPAASAGIHTFWIRDEGHAIPDPNTHVSAIGSYKQFVDRVKGGWLDELEPIAPTSNSLIHRLAAFPASLDVIRRQYSSEVLEYAPADGEWSARHIVCHLQEHETAEDRLRLERIAYEDAPFLSANYDPWEHAHDYDKSSFEVALRKFSDQRRDTVEWLRTLSSDVWTRPARHSIFGPTTFLEMVRFTSEHDLTHLRQMRKAIAVALAYC